MRIFVVALCLALAQFWVRAGFAESAPGQISLSPNILNLLAIVGVVAFYGFVLKRSCRRMNRSDTTGDAQTSADQSPLDPDDSPSLSGDSAVAIGQGGE